MDFIPLNEFASRLHRRFGAVYGGDLPSVSVIVEVEKSDVM